MTDERLFVVTVASEKGGVGKTTIATNLAVYLKALREDLPVTIASFDNHFSVDNMFAIGRNRGPSVAALFTGSPVDELACLGEYGVQFLASERHLAPPDDDRLHLARALGSSALSGILILDTRPILDYFTRSALLAADLVLVPVKDRPSLVNAASLQGALQAEGGDPERLWLVPSLIDARLRLREGLGMREFLTCSARDRGYQMVETFIAKSPKVEGLATNLTSRVFPVLTHARSTAVHRQFRVLADFILQRFDVGAPPPDRRNALGAAQVPPGRTRRLVTECPACGERAPAAAGHFSLDLRSRRRGFIHGGCLHALLKGAELKTLLSPSGALVLSSRGPGLVGPEADHAIALFDDRGEEVAAEQLGSLEGSSLEPFWRGVTGRHYEEMYREIVLVSLEQAPPVSFLAGAGQARFAALRRRILREMAER